MEWTDESIARLRVLWQEGLSTAEIGRRMQITKNAVVGKAHRLDLAARPSPIRKAELPSGTVPAKRPPTEKPRPVAVEPIAPVAPQPADHCAAATPEPVDTPVREPVSIAASETVEPVSVEPAPDAPPAVEPTPEPVAAVLPDNVLLLRPDMHNPAAPDTVPAAIEPVRTVRTQAEPREPRRRGLTCCWPLGEPGTKGFHFCGGDPTPGKPYCAEHAALAYVKLRDRRDSVA